MKRSGQHTGLEAAANINDKIDQEVFYKLNFYAHR